MEMEEMEMEEEEFEQFKPSENWKNGKGGTKADREHGYGFLGQPDDWEEPKWLE